VALDRVLAIALLLLACSPLVAIISTYTVEEAVHYEVEFYLGTIETPLTLLVNRTGIYELEGSVLEVKNLNKYPIEVFVYSRSSALDYVVEPGGSISVNLVDPPYSLKANTTCKVSALITGVKKATPLLPLSILALALPVAGIALITHYVVSRRA